MKIRSRIARVALAALAIALAGCASAYKSSAEPAALTDDRGMTLYTFDKDSKGSGRSACSGDCAKRWPPAAADAVKGADSGAIERTDGTRQATWGGMPLYYFAGDSAPGDRNGDGLGGVWHVATKAAQPRRAGGSYSVPSAY